MPLIQTRGSCGYLTHSCNQGNFRYDHHVSTRGCTGLSTFPGTGKLSTSSPGAVHVGGICYEGKNASLI